MENKKKKDLKLTNITDQELQRDIVNLNLPEANLLEGILMSEDELLEGYDEDFKEWFRNGRKDPENK